MLAAARTRDLPGRVLVTRAWNAQRRGRRNRIVDRLAGQWKQQERFSPVVFIDDVQVGGHRNTEPCKQFISGCDLIAEAQPRFVARSPPEQPYVDSVR